MSQGLPKLHETTRLGFVPESLPTGDVRRERSASARSTLDRIGWNWSQLADLVHGQVDSLSWFLLTSSSVQGVATERSDIDLIAITPHDMDEDRAPAQLFARDRRFELIVFSSKEVTEAFGALSDLMAQAPLRVLQGLRIWDRRHVISLKYLERITNGISKRGDLPFFHHLPTIAGAWVLNSYDKARQYVLSALLAESAGERRSPKVYSLRAVLYLMDVTMSLPGFVFSNVKWFPLRWRRFVDSATALLLPSDFVRQVSAAYEASLASFIDPPSVQRVDLQVLDLFKAATIQLGLPHDLRPADSDEIFRRSSALLDFGGEADLWVDPAEFAVLADGAVNDYLVQSVDDLVGMPASVAASFLRAARCRLLDLSLSAQPLVDT